MLAIIRKYFVIVKIYSSTCNVYASLIESQKQNRIHLFMKKKKKTVAIVDAYTAVILRFYGTFFNDRICYLITPRVIKRFYRQRQTTDRQYPFMRAASRKHLSVVISVSRAFVVTDYVNHSTLK